MTILLTGSTGFVGKHLKKRLESDGHVVLSPARGQIESRHYDVIINCAAELTDESKMYSANVDLVYYLLELARNHGVGKVIQIGSSSEYGLTDQPRVESANGIPSNIYESTKLAATNLCLGYASRYDLDICIARPFSVFGPGDKPRKLIPTLYRSHIDHLTVDLHPGSHDFIYIDDFVDGLMILLNAPKDQTKGDIINFGTGVSSSNDQVVAALESALGSSLFVNRKTGRYHSYDVDNWVADITKARTKYGWQPKHTLQSGMKAYVMVEWFNGDRG